VPGHRVPGRARRPGIPAQRVALRISAPRSAHEPSPVPAWPHRLGSRRRRGDHRLGRGPPPPARPPPRRPAAACAAAWAGRPARGARRACATGQQARPRLFAGGRRAPGAAAQRPWRWRPRRMSPPPSAPCRGVLVKLGQMASYRRRRACRRPSAARSAGLQDSIPAHERQPGPRRLIEDELGLAAPTRPSRSGDPRAPSPPRRSARCTGPSPTTARPLAVKVQYPRHRRDHGPPTWTNVAPAGAKMLKITRAATRDVDAPRLPSCAERVLEELDYEREAANQRPAGPPTTTVTPTIHIPAVIDELSTRRVVTSELSDGARFAELATWSQEERGPGRRDHLPVRIPQPVRGGTRSNGDPHPGNYPVPRRAAGFTFLDFRAGQATSTAGGPAPAS